MRLFLALVCAVALRGAAPEYRLQVVRTYPHDPQAFTQGFEYHDGKFYEGTGLEGRSSVRVEDLATGKLLRQVNISKNLFGEGITVLRGRIFEVTWQSQVGFIYNKQDLKLITELHYPGEGWGLANDGKNIYLSDGTSFIRILNSDFQELRRIDVHDGKQHVEMLNELEWIHGEIWANVWQTDRIVRISPVDGHVVGWINASGLLTQADMAGQPVDVLNGIAYDSRNNRIFLTGKLWPKVFEVRVIPAGVY